MSIFIFKEKFFIDKCIIHATLQELEKFMNENSSCGLFEQDIAFACTFTNTDKCHKTAILTINEFEIPMWSMGFRKMVYIEPKLILENLGKVFEAYKEICNLHEMSYSVSVVDGSLKILIGDREFVFSVPCDNCCRYFRAFWRDNEEQNKICNGFVKAVNHEHAKEIVKNSLRLGPKELTAVISVNLDMIPPSCLTINFDNYSSILAR